MNHKNTELPVQLLLPAVRGPPPQQMKPVYAGEVQRKNTEERLREWAGMAPPTKADVRIPSCPFSAAARRLRRVLPL